MHPHNRNGYYIDINTDWRPSLQYHTCTYLLNTVKVQQYLSYPAVVSMTLPDFLSADFKP